MSVYQSLRPKGLFTLTIYTHDKANKRVQYFPTVTANYQAAIDIKVRTWMRSQTVSVNKALVNSRHITWNMVFGITNSLVQSMIPYLQELQPSNTIKSEKVIQGTTIGSA